MIINVWNAFHIPRSRIPPRDAALNIQFQADWAAIKANKERLIRKNNLKENKSRKEYQYSVGDSMLIKNDWSAKYAKDPYKGPFTITAVNDNGAVCYRDGAITDAINIRNITPYKE